MNVLRPQKLFLIVLSVLCLILLSCKVDAASIEDLFLGEQLLAAVEENNCPLVRNLLERGANINFTDEETRESALIRACRLNHVEMVEVLLANESINVNAADVKGETAMMWAARNNHIIIAEMLLRDGRVSLDALNRNYESALSLAYNLGHEAIVESIRAFKARESSALQMNKMFESIQRYSGTPFSKDMYKGGK